MTTTGNPPDNSSPSSPVQLEINLLWGVPYTHYDDVLSTLLEVITCPITQDVAEHIIVFNDQCYEINAFETHRMMK